MTSDPISSDRETRTSKPDPETAPAQAVPATPSADATPSEPEAADAGPVAAAPETPTPAEEAAPEPVAPEIAASEPDAPETDAYVLPSELVNAHAAPVEPEPAPTPEAAPAEPVAQRPVASEPEPVEPVAAAPEPAYEPEPEPEPEPVAAAPVSRPAPPRRSGPVEAPAAVAPAAAAHYDDDLRLGQPGAPPPTPFRRNRIAAIAVVGLVLAVGAYALTRTLDHARNTPFAGGPPVSVEISKAPRQQDTAPVVEATPYEEGPVTGADAPRADEEAPLAGPATGGPTESPGAMHEVARPTTAPSSPTVAPAAPSPQSPPPTARPIRPIIPPVASTPTPAPQPTDARGDCRSGGRLARMLCEYPDLAAADRRLQRLYQRALSESDDPDDVRDRQSVWMAARDAATRDGPDAVAEVYQNRIDELRREGR
jgi:hypothetical protein